MKLLKRDGFCPPIATERNGHVLCWPATPPGSVANTSCPPDASYDPNQFVYKECWPNGTWFVHPESTNGKDWTNYTNCINNEVLEFNTYINDLFVIGYLVSLVALIISLTIFLLCRSLKCTRIRIHIQLFLSFIMNNVMWIIWYCEVIPRSDLFNSENPFWCSILEFLLRYFLVANYMWMFCEGLYLHISLVVVFVKDEVAWKWFLLIGWGVPLLIISLYVTIRIHVLEDTQGCWMDQSQAEYIYSVPVCITLVASLVFLINVLRVILTIMHPNSDNPAPVRVKKAARAALILIPLFGLQYVLIPFRPDQGHPYAQLYEYVTVVVTSLQGLCVSCLFCFANQDVHHAIRGFINKRLYSSGWSNYQYTGGMDSAGVYVINGNNTNSVRML